MLLEEEQYLSYFNSLYAGIQLAYITEHFIYVMPNRGQYKIQ